MEVSRYNRFLAARELLGHFRSSQRIELNNYAQLRVFDDLPLLNGYPFDREESLRYIASARQYMRQYENLLELGVPLLPARLSHQQMGVIELHADLPLLSLREFLFGILNADLRFSGEENHHVRDLLISDLHVFAKALAPLTSIDGLRLVDIVHVPHQGWVIRSFDGNARMFRSQQNGPAASFFANSILAEVGLGRDAEPYYRTPPGRAPEVLALFADLRQTVQKQRELTHLRPCPVLD